MSADLPVSTYIWPGKTHFGPGTAGMVGGVAAAMGARHALIVSDPGVTGAGLAESVQVSLRAAGLACDLFEDVPPNPDLESVEAGADAFRRYNSNLVLALGGGSALDAAKGVRLLAGAPLNATIDDYLLTSTNPRPAPEASALPPMVAIPTTAGTGSEVTPWGVLTDNEQKVKVSVGGPFLVPTAALVDPALTATLPAPLAAATGLDALSHCIEAYVSPNVNPLLDPMILYGIELIGRSLPQAVAAPANDAARYNVMLGSLIGGIAISSKWLGACHSLAHQLSSLAGLHHGMAIALMLPHQMAFSLEGAPERYARIGAALGGRATAEGAVDAVQKLIKAVGLPTRLRDEGVRRDLIPLLADYAYNRDSNWQTNPYPISQEDMAALYESAY